MNDAAIREVIRDAGKRNVGLGFNTLAALVRRYGSHIITIHLELAAVKRECDLLRDNKIVNGLDISKCTNKQLIDELKERLNDEYY